MAAFALSSGPGVLRLTSRPSVSLLARHSHRSHGGVSSIAKQATAVPSREHGTPQYSVPPVVCCQRRGLVTCRQINWLATTAVARAAVPGGAPSVAPGSPQVHARTIQAISEAKLCHTDTRSFSTTLRRFREDEKQDGVPPDQAGSATTPKPLRSILGAPAHENIYNIPNFLTFTRLLAGPGLAYLIVNSSHVAALGLFVYAGITDALDGYLARRWKQTSVVGSVVDPMADKTLMTAATLALAAQARMPWPLAIIILGRDVLLAISAIYYRWISLPPPKTMTRYWDFSLPSAEVRPTAISKVNTVLQLVLIGATVAMPLVPESITVAWKLGEALVGLQWTVGATTIWSGLSYVGSKDAVRILGQDEKPKGE